MFIPILVSENVCEFSNTRVEKALITVLEAGLLRVDLVGIDFVGSAFVSISRFESFNYNCKEPKKELAKFVFKKLNSFHLSKTYFSGKLFSEINFVIEKKMFTISLRVEREEVGYVGSN